MRTPKMIAPLYAKRRRPVLFASLLLHIFVSGCSNGVLPPMGRCRFDLIGWRTLAGAMCRTNLTLDIRFKQKEKYMRDAAPQSDYTWAGYYPLRLFINRPCRRCIFESVTRGKTRVKAGLPFRPNPEHS